MTGYTTYIYIVAMVLLYCPYVLGDNHKCLYVMY